MKSWLTFVEEQSSSVKIGFDYTELKALEKGHKAFMAQTLAGLKYITSNKIAGVKTSWDVSSLDEDYWTTFKEFDFLVVYTTEDNKYLIEYNLSHLTLKEIVDKDNREKSTNNKSLVGKYTFNDIVEGSSKDDLMKKNASVIKKPIEQLRYEKMFVPNNAGKVFVSDIKLKNKSFKGSAINKIVNNIDCYNCGLESLDGSPDTVKKELNCSKNNLKSFKGAPKHIGILNCMNNPITSVDGLPKDLFRLVLSKGCVLTEEEIRKHSNVVHIMYL